MMTEDEIRADERKKRDAQWSKAIAANKHYPKCVACSHHDEPTTSKICLPCIHYQNFTLVGDE